jgi:Na+/H+ antiporter NhaD/arsenite permease-like protein
MSVVRILPWYVFTIIVLIIVAGMDYKILFRADYVLLFTFIGFFVFTGNMGNIEAISSFLQEGLSGREFPISIALSQIISNVPATLMLSGFTTDHRSLLLGVNIGGLGTPIASLASLISMKLYAHSDHAHTGKYLLEFTAFNLALLARLSFAQAVFPG